MLGTIERKLTLGFLAATLVVIVMSGGFYHAAQKFYDNDRWVEHGNAIIGAVEETSNALKDLEANQHSFLATGDLNFLQMAQGDTRALPAKIAPLAALVADNPAQAARVAELRPAVQAEIEAAQRAVEDRQRLGAAALDPRNLSRKNWSAVTDAGRMIDVIKGDAAQTVRECTAVRQKNFGLALSVSIGLAGLLSILLALVHFIVFRELRARRRVETELGAARDVALSSAKTKSEFLANMSHEIRTPMNGIIGMTGLLVDTKLTVEQREFAVTVQNCADSLLTIINDILDFSKIEAGKLTFEVLDFDIRQVVESTIEILAERAQSKNLELISLIDSGVPVDLCGDAGRLRQVMLNLLSNAVKFTDKGEVSLHVRSDGVSETEVRLLFEIVDTGIGLGTEAQGRIFQPFSQADGSTTRKYGGTGLGLAISRGLVERMNGQIGVKSEIGVGSNFWFTAQLTKQVNPPSRPTRRAPANLRVLVVDDNVACCQALGAMLESWNIKFAFAHSGRDALGVMRSAGASGDPFQIALLDMQMPGMSGFALTEEIKRDAVLATTQLIIMHTIGRRGSSSSWAEAGINGYVTKPVKQSALFDAIMDAVATPSGPRLGVNVPKQQTFKTTTELSRLMMRPVAAPRMSSVRILLAEDNMVNQKVALRQLLNLGFRADAVANGREVIEALARIPYRLVFMDCQMPEMDGYQATQILRNRTGHGDKVTIIAMTANALEGDRETCLAAGMDDYLSKPVKQEDLERVLRRWLPDRRVSALGAGDPLSARAGIGVGGEMPCAYSVHPALWRAPVMSCRKGFTTTPTSWLMATQSDKNPETLQTYANDMLTLQKHILEAVEHQLRLTSGSSTRRRPL